MEIMKKKVCKILWSLTMVFAMVFIIMPTIVFAANQASDITINSDGTLTFGGNVVTSGELGIITNEASVKFRVANKTDMEVKNYKDGVLFNTILAKYINNFNFSTGNGWKTGKLKFTYTDGSLYFTVTPIIKPNVTVNDGTGAGEYEEGTIVTITANTPATGKRFKEWTAASGDVTFADPTSVTTTFTMPAEDVEVTAAYEDAVIPPTPEKPTITAVAGSTYQISNGKDMTFTCSGKLEDLTGIYVDGKLVDESNYTLKSGSTILTFKASYLDTLSVGKHTLQFQYKDNISAEMEFSITEKAPEEPSSPQTGDTANIMLYMSLIVLSGNVAWFGLRKKRALNK